MSMLGSWGVSGPRFDTIEDWTNLARIKPQKNGAASPMKRSSSSGQLLAGEHQRALSSSASAASLQRPGMLTHGGTGRVPSSVFASNPYQVNRPGVAQAIGHTLSSGGLTSPQLGSPSHSFAIHQLPRARGQSASGNYRQQSPIAVIPPGSPLPLSPSGGRLTLIQQQTLPRSPSGVNLSGEFAAASGNTSYNPYLLTESSSGSPSQNALFRRTKTLDQRLADYLKPPRSSPGGSGGSPGHKRASTDTASPGAGRNISVHVVPHPRSPLGSLGEQLVADEAKEQVEQDQQGQEETMGPRKAKRLREEREAAEAEAKAQAKAAARAGQGKKGGKTVQVPEEEATIPEPEPAISSSDSKDTDSEDATIVSAPGASMNLRAVLRAQKAQELQAKEEKEKEKERGKPWTGVTWTDILQARNYLLAQAKAGKNTNGVTSVEKSGPTTGAAGGPASPTKTSALNASLAMQVAQHWLSTTRKDSGSKKPFNVYSLSEFQRIEYKLAVAQGAWLNMYAKEDMTKHQVSVAAIQAQATKDAASSSSSAAASHSTTSSSKAPIEFLPELIPNEQKRVSSKTRMMNMARGETPTGSSSQSLLYNTYVSCNSQYGYVRYVGRVPWATGMWVGMELVEKHPHHRFGAWVDFYHEHSAISMQMVEESNPTPQVNTVGSPTNASAAQAQMKRRASTAADSASGGTAANPTNSTAPQQQMMINTAIPRPLVLAAMLPPAKEKSAARLLAEKSDKGANEQYQPLSASVFPFIDVAAFMREGLVSCFDMHELDPGLAYFAPVESVKRVAQKAKIDSKALLSHKENQTNPFADVDELACGTPKKHEGTVDMLARYLTVSDREVLDGERNKARSIFRWICHNIRYDPTAPKGTDVISIIRHRKATGEGFAVLFHALATAGGLQALRIRGVEKTLNHRTDQVMRNKHAWNAIKIDGEWSFIDCVFSCGQFIPPDPNTKVLPGQAPLTQTTSGTFQQMFSDAYFCTPPSLFILEHFPVELIPALPTDTFKLENPSKLLPAEYNNLQLLRSTVSAAEFEKGLIPGRAFVEYHMRASQWQYHIECKQPSCQIEITAPAFILFEVDLKIKGHTIDLSQVQHVQYDGEQVCIHLIFPVPGEYICKITCKPSWRELDIYDNCLTYHLTSHTGLVPLSSNKDVIIGFMQHRKMNARDSRGLFNRHFTLLHPLSGHLIPRSPFSVQVKGPDIADSVIVACNGDWQRLSSSALAKTATGNHGTKVFEGQAVIQPKYELQIFYEMDKKFHLLFNYKANLTSFSNVYQETSKRDSERLAQEAALVAKQNSALSPDLWHGKCVLGIEGRVFDASLSLDVPNCRFGKQVCTFVIHCSIQWDIALQVQEGWKNGTPLPENMVVVEEVKAFRTHLMTQYKITTTLPATAALVPAASPVEKLRQLTISKPAAAPSPSSGSHVVALDFVNTLTENVAKREAAKNQSNKLPINKGPEVEEELKASTKFTLVINARNIKQGGPMRYALSYYFDVAKAGTKAENRSNATIEEIN